MVKNPELLAEFEKKLARSQPPDYIRGLAIYEALYREAVALGVLPLKNPLEGLDTVIALTRSLNYGPRTPRQTGN